MCYSQSVGERVVLNSNLQYFYFLSPRGGKSSFIVNLTLLGTYCTMRDPSAGVTAKFGWQTANSTIGFIGELLS